MSEPQPLPSLSLVTRLWFAWACFFRVLFDASFSGRAWLVRDALPAPAAPAPGPARESVVPSVPSTKPSAVLPSPPPNDAALQLLALFQREGRLVDFLEQDVSTFPDADVGAAARVVHEGCRKALRAHAQLDAIRTEEEGARVTVNAGFVPSEIKLSGNVAGEGPYSGVLRHRGWRVTRLTLATPTGGHDLNILAPAEIEL